MDSLKGFGFNSTYAQVGVQCFFESEELNQSSVFIMKFSDKNPRLRVAANRHPNPHLNTTDQIQKTLNAQLESGLIWSLRIIIPLMVLSPLVPRKRVGWHPYWSGEYSYFETMLFYSVIILIALLVIVLRARFRARKKSRAATDFTDVCLEVKSVEKRKYGKSTLFVLKDKEKAVYAYLADAASTLDLKPGTLQATIHLDSKVIIELIESDDQHRAVE